MKAYVITTGTVFGLITLAHVWRVFAEHTYLVTDPVFVLLTVLAAGLCLWACRLLRRGTKDNGRSAPNAANDDAVKR